MRGKGHIEKGARGANETEDRVAVNPQQRFHLATAKVAGCQNLSASKMKAVQDAFKLSLHFLGR